MTNMKTKRDVTVHLGRIDEEYYNDTTLGHIKVRLDEIEQEAKDQGFDIVNARVDGTIYFTAIRKETDEEVAIRIKYDEDHKKFQRDYDYKQYLKYKAMFE